ncbi:Microtubule-associated protein 70-5, partial [Morella rubra]
LFHDNDFLNVSEKDRELFAAQGEIKALRGSEALKDKAVEELRNEVAKMEGKLRVTENLLQNKIAALQEDKKALERLTKSKETALLEAERILRSALERALIVEEVQNHNYELKRQIEICQACFPQEENRILEKTNRQKVLEVEKLSQTIQELEEAILAGGAAANAIRDYKRQIEELHEEKRTLERELARVKVLANRVATVVANEWKDENEKVMPVKKWIEERRLLQAEMQRLRDKLAISERTAKAEAQLKDKLKLRLKIIEEGLKDVSSFAFSPNRLRGSPKTEKSSNIFGFLTSNGGLRKRSTSQPRDSIIGRSSPLQQPNVENEIAGVAEELKQENSLRKKSTSEKICWKKAYGHLEVKLLIAVRRRIQK